MIELILGLVIGTAVGVGVAAIYSLGPLAYRLMYKPIIVRLGENEAEAIGYTYLGQPGKSGYLNTVTIIKKKKETLRAAAVENARNFINNNPERVRVVRILIQEVDESLMADPGNYCK